MANLTATATATNPDVCETCGWVIEIHCSVCKAPYCEWCEEADSPALAPLG
ncbi:hypothetical protein [Streptomyces smyrnaeus]|uniref:hypothetical protein n=1 Tax=Streptomyces smyrnaeus TaxID=1387713 RepID=UPI0036BA0D01